MATQIHDLDGPKRKRDGSLGEDKAEVKMIKGNEGKGQMKGSKGMGKAGTKVKGKGSQSGKNARPPGISDDEITQLPPSDIPDSGIKKPKQTWVESDKEKLISYIVDSEQWANFKINQAKIFQYVSFNGTKIKCIITFLAML